MSVAAPTPAANPAATQADVESNDSAAVDDDGWVVVGAARGARRWGARRELFSEFALHRHR